MNKTCYKYYDIIYLLIILSFVLLIVYHYLFIGIVHCDGYINDIAVFEPLTGEIPSQENLSTSSKNNSIETTGLRENTAYELKSGINCFTVYSKYKNIGRRKLYWHSCIKNKGAFISYEDYKPYWDPDIKVLSEINRELKREVHDEFKKFFLVRRTFNWFFKPSNSGGGRGL